MGSLRQRHAEQTRDAIVAAAYELFATKGFAETTIDEIAERADIAPRTFFRYFPAKEAVLFHGTEGQVDDAVARLRARPADEAPFESLLAVLRSIAAELTNGDKRELMLAKFAAQNERLFEHHRAVVMCQFEEKIAAVLHERAGEEADPLAIEAAVAAVLATFGTAIRSWIRAGAKDDFEPFLERCVSAAQGAFHSAPAASPR
jgi:AcrR family transcriptional regulator